MRTLLFMFAAALCAQEQAPTSEPKQRVRAVRELGKQGSETIPKLQEYLSDPVVDVRVEAVQGDCRNRNATKPRSADPGHARCRPRSPDPGD